MGAEQLQDATHDIEFLILRFRANVSWAAPLAAAARSRVVLLNVSASNDETTGLVQYLAQHYCESRRRRVRSCARAHAADRHRHVARGRRRAVYAPRR